MVTRVHSIVDTIIAANFMANAVQVEQLAGSVALGVQADSTYFRVLLAHMQSRLGRPGRGRRRAQAATGALELLEQLHSDFYPHVLKGVGPEELDADERNRRGTFARSAASTIRYFIERGGDVRTVEVATITKAGLRRMVQPEQAQAPEGETRTERSFRKATDAVVKSAQRLLARGDPDTARERIEAAINALEDLLEQAEAQQAAAAQTTTQPDVGATTTTIVAGRGAGRSAPASQPMLHRSA